MVRPQDHIEVTNGIRYSRSLTRYRPHVAPYRTPWEWMLSRPAGTLAGARLGMIIGMIGSVTRTRMPATISAMPPARESPPHPRSSVSLRRRDGDWPDERPRERK